MLRVRQLIFIQMRLRKDMECGVWRWGVEVECSGGVWRWSVVEWSGAEVINI